MKFIKQVNTIVPIIFNDFPKSIRWMLGAITAAVTGYFIFLILSGAPFKIKMDQLFELLLVMTALLITGFLVGTFRAINQLKTRGTTANSDMTAAENKIDVNKKILPYSKIELGNYESETIAVGILADILLEESIKPGTELFLNRVDAGEPYCPKCKNPMESWNAGPKAGFVQIGYKCINCRTKHGRNRDELIKDISGEIRRNYDNYWNRYVHQINKITNGRPGDYMVR
jgi:hypothetical protein